MATCDLWTGAGLDLLAEEGAAALPIERLAARVGRTKEVEVDADALPRWWIGRLADLVPSKLTGPQPDVAYPARAALDQILDDCVAREDG